MDEVAVIIESNAFSIDPISTQVRSFLPEKSHGERKRNRENSFRGRKCCKLQFADLLSKAAGGREKENTKA